MIMNRYGRAAFTHWREHLPHRYGTLPDPLAYFTQLGIAAERQAGELRDAMVLAGTPADGETEERRSHRIASVGDEADRIVLHELTRPPAAAFPDGTMPVRVIAVPSSPS
ncbi:hypothetical protein [Streptomyces aureus]|uniref:hypothetical protein n=1 Tax=Streptomyces aureus TaxID=193461 RepID=UPI00068F3FD2|nr:hypothetical protein [Streptomyces aureus]